MRYQCGSSGYDDFLRKIVVEPGRTQTVQVAMHLSPRAVIPDVTATLKLSVEPGRAALFLDDKYVGHASEFGGLRSMLISPGKYRIKVGRRVIARLKRRSICSLDRNPR
jgi:hypothetical protein